MLTLGMFLTFFSCPLPHVAGSANVFWEEHLAWLGVPLVTRLSRTCEGGRTD